MLSIKLNSLTAHDTIDIVLGDDSYTIDLYYYCLDNTFIKREEGLAKGLLNFFAMIENWKLKIRNLSVNKSDVLPFDYSDQYVGFFVVSRIDNENVSIQAASSTEYQGCSINPSQLYLENFISKPYRLKDNKYVIPMLQLFQGIDDSLANIFREFYNTNFVKI